jgi:hypothetical protein
MTSVAIVSGWFGDYEHRPSPLPRQRGDVSAVLATDADGPVPSGWGRAWTGTRPPSPRWQSKLVKCRPWEYVIGSFDVIVWIDAQVRVVGPGFAEWCVRQLEGPQGAGGVAEPYGIAAMAHPAGRRSITEEALAGQGPAGRGRFLGQRSVEQARHYVAEGHPDAWGLWWTMVLVARNDERFRRFGVDWLEEQRRWSTHDQVSFPHLVRDHYGADGIRTMGWPTDVVWP